MMNKGMGRCVFFYNKRVVRGKKRTTNSRYVPETVVRSWRVCPQIYGKFGKWPCGCEFKVDAKRRRCQKQNNSLIWTPGLVIRVRLCDRYPQFTSGTVRTFQRGNFPAPVHPGSVCFVHYNPSIWYLNWTGDESRSVPVPVLVPVLVPVPDPAALPGFGSGRHRREFLITRRESVD